MYVYRQICTKIIISCCYADKYTVNNALCTYTMFNFF